MQVQYSQTVIVAVHALRHTELPLFLWLALNDALTLLISHVSDFCCAYIS